MIPNSHSTVKKLNPWLIVILPVLLLILGATVHYLRGSYTVGSPVVKSWGVDDAYITYRYSWNLTHFQTLSWNESGFRRTEGFTNPLWVMSGIAWTLFGNKDLVYPLSVLTSILFTSILFVILILAVIKKASIEFRFHLGIMRGFIRSRNLAAYNLRSRK